MEFLQVCYRSKMRLYPDRPDVLTTGRWYWCPEGAEELPFPHAFGSMLFDPPEFKLADDQVGEVEWIEKVRGDGNPRYRGRHHCGAAELYSQGSPFALRGTLPTDGEGVPLCCDAVPVVGGLAIGGTGEASSWADVSFWLRNADLPSASSVPNPLSFWPAAPLTSYFGSPLVGTPSVLLDGPFATVQLGAPMASDHGAVALIKEGGGTPSFPGDFTIWAALRGIGPNPAFYLLPSVVGSGHPILYADYTGSGVQGSGIVYSPVPLAIDGGSVYCWRRSGGTTEVWRNRVLLASAAGGAALYDPTLFSCHLSAPLTTLACHVFELMGFPRTLSTGEMNAYWDYFQPYEDFTVIPTGMMSWFAMLTPQDGWLLCDGAEYDVSAFPSLAAYLAAFYDLYRGAAAPSAGKFRVPDCRGMAMICAGGASINPFTTARALGDTLGEENHQLDQSELAAHAHTWVDSAPHQHATMQAPAVTVASFLKGAPQGLSSASILIPMTTTPLGGSLTGSQGITGSNQNTGGDVAHNTMQPSGAYALFIKT